MAIVYRTDDGARWGAGKGSNLAPAEVDVNFWEVVQRLVSLETNPPAAISVDDVTVAGNQLTVHLTDGSTRGPFTLPTAQWRWTGAWRTATVYFVNDIFSFDGAIYRVAVSHTSDATTFDPNALAELRLRLQSAAEPAGPALRPRHVLQLLDPGGRDGAAPACRRPIIRGAGRLPAERRVPAGGRHDARHSRWLCYKNDDIIGHLEFEPGQQHDQRWRSVRDLHSSDAAGRHPVRPRRPLQGLCARAGPAHAG